MAMMSLEQQLGQAFDNLVDNWSAGSPHQRQVQQVADFVRLFVQNLFSLSASDFLQTIKAHHRLHTLAASWERKGRNPVELLRQQQQQPDHLGRLLRTYANHLGALDCMLDVRATAALVHHLRTMSPSSLLPAQIVGCELGAGFGILSVAGVIPLLAAGHQVQILAFEQAEASLVGARKLAATIVAESRYGQKLDIVFAQADITSPEPYQQVMQAMDAHGPLALWLSETFGYQSRCPIIGPGYELNFVEPEDLRGYSQELEAKYDPLPKVLELSHQHFPHFLENIAQSRLLAFPDIVTPRVVIDGRQSAMKLADGSWCQLGRIGEGYTVLPASAQSRWHLSDEDVKKPARTFSTSKRKRVKQRR